MFPASITMSYYAHGKFATQSQRSEMLELLKGALSLLRR